MIDTRTSAYRKLEWLLRNPVLSQSGEMQASELETLALLGQGEEAQMSPNFFERDQLENFSLPFDLELINDDKNAFPSSDDKLVDTGMNIDTDLSLLSELDNNAVDPSLYINTNDSAERQNVKPVAENQLPPVEQIPNVQMNWQLPASQSEYARQESVNFVMEVLSACPVSSSEQTNSPDLVYPLTPSPELGEENALAHSSPCFLQQELQRTRTVSDHLHFFSQTNPEPSRTRAFSEDLVFPQTSCGFNASPTAAIQHAANENGSSTSEQNDTSSTADRTASDAKSEETPALESLPSFIKDPLQNPPNPINDDSLDMMGMLNDFLVNSAIPSSKTKSTEVEQIAVPQSTIDLTTLEEPSTSTYVPKMERSASYKRRRTQNNKACRESRKKRKVKESAMEDKAKELETENGQLRVQIQQLQLEVDKVQKLVLLQMSGRQKR